MSNRGAILLVGGMGTRLQPLTLQTPKPMLPVAGVPFTEHQIVKAREAGIKEIVLATSFKAELFEPYFGDGSKFGISIKYAVEKQALGTGGAIRNASNLLSKSFGSNDQIAIFNGDVLSGHDLNKQFEFHTDKKAEVTLYLTEVLDARAFGAVELESDGRVIAFNEKMENPPTNIINAGCYIFNREIIDLIPSEKVLSVERETFPEFLSSGKRVFGYVDRSYWLDLGTPAAMLKASKDLVAGKVFSAATPIHDGEFLALSGADIAASAIVDGFTVIGRDVKVGEGAKVSGCVINDGVKIGDRVQLTNCFVAPGFEIPAATIAEESYFGY